MTACRIDRRELITATGAAIALSWIPSTHGLAQIAAEPSTRMDPTPMTNAATYHFAIGDIDATVVSDGQIAFPAYPTYAPDQTESEIHHAMRSHGLTPPDYVLDANALVLRTAERTVLIDTGWGPFAPGVGRTADNLRRIGVDPSAIDIIVLSHIHPDHVGGLRTAEGELVYPHAQVFVPEADLSQWRDVPDFGAMTVDENFRPVFVSAARSVLTLGDRLEPARDGMEVAPGVALVEAPGHTRGHSVVRVTSGDASFLYAADAFHDPAFDLAHPGWRTAFDYDPSEAATSRRRLLDEAAAESSVMMAYHMPFPSIGQVERSDSGYRWHGARWDLG